jgi:hypothetical protein
MKIAGFLLLFAGWLLVLAALGMLPDSVARNVFVLAGLGVQATGLTITVRAHRSAVDPGGSRR